MEDIARGDPHAQVEGHGQSSKLPEQHHPFEDSGYFEEDAAGTTENNKLFECIHAHCNLAFSTAPALSKHLDSGECFSSKPLDEAGSGPGSAAPSGSPRINTQAGALDRATVSSPGFVPMQTLPENPDLGPSSMHQGDLGGAQGLEIPPSPRQGSLGQLPSRGHAAAEGTRVKSEPSEPATAEMDSPSEPQEGGSPGSLVSTEAPCKGQSPMDDKWSDFCSTWSDSPSESGGSEHLHEHTKTPQANHVLMRVGDSMFVNAFGVLGSIAPLGRYIIVGCHEPGDGAGPSHPAAGGSGSGETAGTAGGTGTRPSRPPRGLGPGQKRRQGGRGDDGPSEDERPREDDSKRRRTSGDGPEARFFACPYLKRDPSRYHRCCYGRKLVSISRLKSHLLRLDGRHCRAPYCARCARGFPTEAARDAHARAGACEAADPPAEPQGLSYEARRALGRRLGPGRDDAAQWYAIWDLLFPGAARPASPYSEPEDLSGLCRSPPRRPRRGGGQARPVSRRGPRGGQSPAAPGRYEDVPEDAQHGTGPRGNGFPPLEGVEEVSTSSRSAMRNSPGPAAAQAAHRLWMGTWWDGMPPARALDADVGEITSTGNYRYDMTSTLSSDGTGGQAAATFYAPNETDRHQALVGGSLYPLPDHWPALHAAGPQFTLSGADGFDAAGMAYEAAQAFDGRPGEGFYEQLITPASSSRHFQSSQGMPVGGFIPYRG